MEQIKTTAPPVYVIWAEGWTDGPLSGQNGYLAENGARLFFTGKEAAELKIHDLRNGCLNKHPAAGYHCINFNGSSLPDQDLTVEAIRTYDLQPDFDPEDYVATGQAYGNTGGGCMVGTMAFRLPSLDRSVWVNCNDERVVITSADYVWNEDHSGSWKRYEDVLLFQADFQASQPEDLGAWLPMVREALRYTAEQELSRLGKTLKIPASWQSLMDTPQPAGPEMTSLC